MAQASSIELTTDAVTNEWRHPDLRIDSRSDVDAHRCAASCGARGKSSPDARLNVARVSQDVLECRAKRISAATLPLRTVMQTTQKALGHRKSLGVPTVPVSVRHVPCSCAPIVGARRRGASDPYLCERQAAHRVRFSDRLRCCRVLLRTTRSRCTTSCAQDRWTISAVTAAGSPGKWR